ncbi:sulfatase-like hydrolase/transferase [Candidatus Kapabacteria bacterium]|nr:sulfatase-like hydrolase/transferase [Candidatus Kapabacteria bacterium]
MIKKSSYCIAILLFLFNLSGCDSDDNIDINQSINSPNILLIIADDLGKDAINGYSEGSIKPNTPTLDSIRLSGINFNNFWVYPTCTPTRASIITGKYGYRTGVKFAGDRLSESEVTLQKYISDQTSNKYANAIVGKWHLSGNNLNANPESFGIDYYVGLIRGAANDYYQWQKSEDGTTTNQTSYITEHFTDLSIDWINNQSKPWFLWLAYNAPHTPFHNPPSSMHSQGALPDYVDGVDPTPYYMAAIEAIDFQIARLLDSIPEEQKQNTIIIFMGDNGSPGQVAQSPYSNRKSKGSLYQGGINVPLFVSGSNVSRIGSDNNLITSTDLYSTISEIAGISTSEIHDSKSFRSLFTQNSNIRNYQYSEMNDGTNDFWTISNGEYKLIVESTDNHELYNLTDDPYENNDLLRGTLTGIDSDAKNELEQELLNIRN